MGISDDQLAASVFAPGLSLGFVRREDVVRWADSRIENLDSPPGWLIDLSLSNQRELSAVISHLKEVSENIDAEATCRAIYAILPQMEGCTFDQAARFAKQLHKITQHCLKGDWSNPLLRATDRLLDNYDLVLEGVLAAADESVIRDIVQFVKEHRNDEIVRLLDPVKWSIHADEPPKPTPVSTGALVDVGLSSWIIQDGNYGDFFVGQESKFALEFYSSAGLASADAGPAVAEHLVASRYRIRARVVFADANVWVIDAGDFVAFREELPPPQAVVDNWVDGEIHLGIDPFFYFEYLHRTEGMPRLTYMWIIRTIKRETTPWIEMKDVHGRTYLTRDASREMFVAVRETKAWHDDDGSADYVLGCERISGPTKPNDA